MISIPIYDLLVLPEVTFYFKKDMFPGNEITTENVGEDILFLMLKTDKKPHQIQPEECWGRLRP